MRERKPKHDDAHYPAYIRRSTGAGGNGSVLVPLKWLCKECGVPINEGYTWNGLCVVCAEPYVNPHYEQGLT